MKTSEIVQMYKEAKDKNAQIEILADLACCSKEDILLVLQNEGLISGIPAEKKTKKATTYRKSGSPRLVWDEELMQMVRSLLEEGMTIAAIAERIGWDVAQVQYGISRYKLRGETKNKESAPEPLAEAKEPQDALYNVSLIRDYARCITLLSKENLANYEAIVGVFAESILKGANGILAEAKKFGV